MTQGFLSSGFGVATCCDVAETEKLPLSKDSCCKSKDYVRRTTWEALVLSHSLQEDAFTQEDSPSCKGIFSSVRSGVGGADTAFQLLPVHITSLHQDEEAAITYHLSETLKQPVAEADFRRYLCFTCAPETNLLVGLW